jgi:hypothetical protein
VKFKSYAAHGALGSKTGKRWTRDRQQKQLEQLKLSSRSR